MKKFKTFVIGLIVGLLLTTGVFASSEQIQAVFVDFKLSINGENFGLKSTPIVYNGTSYLPVRDIGEVLGYKVDYDSKTKTIILNDSYQSLKTESTTVSIGEEFDLDGNTKIKVTSVEYQDTFDYSESYEGEVFSVVYYDILTSLEPSNDYYWNPFSFVDGFTVGGKTRRSMSAPADVQRIKANVTSSSVVYTNVPIVEKPTSIIFKSPNSNKTVEVKLK